MKTDREIREKLIVSGPDKLSDAELLAVIIREGTETLSAVGLAEKILTELRPAVADHTDRGDRPRGVGMNGGGAANGNPGALAELASAGVQRIRRAAGCGTVKAAQIAAAGELARRITSEAASAVNVIGSKEDVVKIFAPLAELGHEEFWALYLTSGGRVLDRARLSQGGVAGTVVDHKLVVKRALELLASSLILVHNHPSGVASPSADDLAVTETVGAAAALFDISVVDHIIVSRSGNYSFAENGRMPRTSAR